MGAGGQRTAEKGTQGEGFPANRVPSGKPPFSLADVRRAIPAHCFERSTVRSFSYLLADLIICTALAYAATWIDHEAVPRPLAWLVLWPLYWFWQGAVATGVWVIAHECGHGAFSDYAWLNDTVGLVMHSLLLVPYYSWKHSHRRHHQNTGSTERDEVFVPKVMPPGSRAPALWKSPWYRATSILITQVLGWPLYLMFNVGGRFYERWANHFDPNSPIFTKKERAEVAISDAALAVVIAGLVGIAKLYGVGWLVKMYVVPYFIVNHWLVMITLLQHTHPSLPHYGGKEWDWLRGAMATVDRSYGFLDVVFHHIADTHVAHHLFSYMPHYHAQEATQAIQRVLGDYYARDNRNVFKALWQDYEACCIVRPDKDDQEVYWYTN
ncbi:fatty acid desaturase, delta-12 [Dunaliella salina]|uniref:Fatty acid desaturase, delta-12 n=1 Tax=Dunaliella salina TaxID=3046 RepID=A0ABQ7GB55_DUNSA|nr:fatty acid desaturase, delta-12 [Dunaliella salina]|eukprot:KAF5831839.1 fatty acid desaturase, delta-12 [Dunaliella salina]